MHFLKSIEKKYKYEMDPGSILKDRADTILSTDGQADKVKPVQPPSTSLSGEYKNLDGI